jgi:hypothetical protein
MATSKTASHQGYQLNATVDQYQSGPFVGMWFVSTQTTNYPMKGIHATVAHEQNNGPCGSEDDAFKKAFSTLRRFIDDDLARQKASRGTLRDGTDVQNG